MRNKFVTKQEKKILELVKAGYTNQKVADELFISVATVKKHLQNIYRKLGADNKVSALLKAGIL